MQKIQMFFRFFRPNCSGAGDKITRCWSRRQKSQDVGVVDNNHKMLEPETKISKCWSRRQKSQDVGARDKNLKMLEPETKISRCWSRRRKSQDVGARDKNLKMLEPETKISRCWSRRQKSQDVGAGDKNLDARSWNRSLKFEYRLHSLGAQKTYWRFHCSVTYVIEQWRSYHANFSFIVT